jgi:Predicted nucleoside-diphosphate-sugar epimerases
MERILIIGGTGNVGRHVVTQLSGSGTQVRALARNPATAQLRPEVEVVRGDLTVPESLDRCLDGIDTVFLVWVAPPAAAGPALEAIARHARRIVYLSAPLKTPHPFFQQPNPSRALAERIERLIETSGLKWTFLRPGMLASNALGWWGRRFVPATSCAGRTSALRQPRSMSVTSPPSLSALCVRRNMPERSMF